MWGSDAAVTMDDLKILEDYRYTLMEINAISKQIEQLRIPMEPSAIKAAPVGEKKTGTNDQLHAALQAADGLDAVLQAQMKVLKRRAAAFENVLAGIDDPRTRTVVRLYYGLGYSDEMVSRNMGISRMTAWNVRSAMIKKIKAETEPSNG